MSLRVASARPGSSLLLLLLLVLRPRKACVRSGATGDTRAARCTPSAVDFEEPDLRGSRLTAPSSLARSSPIAPPLALESSADPAESNRQPGLASATLFVEPEPEPEPEETRQIQA
ncbi:hypothetical protein M440DRAFT_1392267 [Trichoderma longibrachiatum ATCC 18648]|uniref:Uncharacterized protein n=1 Tax=Trichoderma longibrachiatum ATCC 18648 TaxID=983965 RepID=A0A2T4C2G6_TRILO|nr:hypothetical protein M440DRAFT_1392267 [Trichoderma longibrachiatum ATCC 18648]